MPPGSTIGGVELIAAVTIWGLFAAFLLFPMLELPAALQKAAGALLVAEGVALLIWGYGDEGCLERPCAPLAEVGYAAAKYDIPLLALALLAVAGISGRRRQREMSRPQRQRTTLVRGPE